MNFSSPNQHWNVSKENWWSADSKLNPGEHLSRYTNLVYEFVTLARHFRVNSTLLRAAVKCRMLFTMSQRLGKLAAPNEHVDGLEQNTRRDARCPQQSLNEKWKTCSECNAHDFHGSCSHSQYTTDPSHHHSHLCYFRKRKIRFVSSEMPVFAWLSRRWVFVKVRQAR